MTDAEPSTATELSAEAVSERILNAALGAVDVLALYLGDRLGWYRSLTTQPATAAELAERTGTSARYAQEWLEQQAVSGFLLVETGDGAEAAAEDEDDAGNAGPQNRRYMLPPGAAEALTDENSLNYLAPLARMIAGAAVELPSLLDAYRSGGGVPWSKFGADARESQADMNRPWFEQELAEALAGTADLNARLQRRNTRIADIGCGAGWSSLAIARAYPDARVEGFDLDVPSIKLARDNAAASEVSDRVSFQAADAKTLPPSRYDAVFAFECIHDMPYPVEVLAAARSAFAPDGFMVVMDEAVAEDFKPNGDDVERLMYGFSLLICLPDGMAHPRTAATGTVMRPETLRRYAHEAGFSALQILPIENFGFWRFYLLTA